MSDPAEPSGAESSSPFIALARQHASAMIALLICALSWLFLSNQALEKYQGTLTTMLLFAGLSLVCSVLSVHTEKLARRATHATLAAVLLLAGCNILKHLLMVCVLLFALTLLRAP
jgi:hypothetical protein